MNCFEIRSWGIDNLTKTERPEPKPGPGQAVVKLRAASLNYRDLRMVEGVYNPKLKLPLIPLSDGVGEVVAVGEGVTRVKMGDRVAGAFSQTWLSGEATREKLRGTLGGPLDGMLTQHAVLHEDGLVYVPSHLSDEEAATLPCAATTAWSALVREGNVKAGDTVLVQGTGGVSIFALQIGRLLGARVIVTSSSDAKLKRARALGASETINYKTTPDWEKRARELTDGTGVDIIVEVGGAGTFNRSARAIRIGGRIVLIGILAGGSSEINLIPLFMQNVRVQGILVGPREAFEDMNRAIALHKLRPVVDRVFPFDDAREALTYMASGAHFGKVCIRM